MRWLRWVRGVVVLGLAGALVGPILLRRLMLAQPVGPEIARELVD
jgi:hypothetical protein